MSRGTTFISTVSSSRQSSERSILSYLTKPLADQIVRISGEVRGQVRAGGGAPRDRRPPGSQVTAENWVEIARFRGSEAQPDVVPPPCRRFRYTLLGRTPPSDTILWVAGNNLMCRTCSEIIGVFWLI